MKFGTKELVPADWAFDDSIIIECRLH